MCHSLSKARLSRRNVCNVKEMTFLFFEAEKDPLRSTYQKALIEGCRGLAYFVAKLVYTFFFGSLAFSHRQQQRQDWVGD